MIIQNYAYFEQQCYAKMHPNLL